MATIYAYIDQDSRKIIRDNVVVGVKSDVNVDVITFVFKSTFDAVNLTTAAKSVFYLDKNGDLKEQLLTTMTENDLGDYEIPWSLPSSLLEDPIRVKYGLTLTETDSNSKVTKRWVTADAVYKIQDSIYSDGAEEPIDEDKYAELAALMNKVLAAANKVGETSEIIANISGSAPTFVDTLADRTDNTKIYVVKADGNLYYYSGSDWANAGKYGSYELDATLTQSGKAADAGAVGAAIDEVKEDLSAKTGLSEEAKQALLNCFSHVAWVDANGQTYYDALEDALYPPVNLVSISAVYTQSGTVYDTDNLNSLKADLVVTAHYSDGTSGIVTGYVLSGTLAEGTSTITVTYSGKTTTFAVTVTHAIVGWYYPFNDSIISAGTKDFGFSGVANYATGVNGNAYYHEVTTEGTSSTDVYGIKSVALSEIPNLSGDFTLSLWHKSKTAKRGHPFSNNKYLASGAINTLPAPENIASGWTVTIRDASRTYAGLSFVWASQILYVRVFTGTNATGGGAYAVTPPASFDTTQWHHYALARSGDTLMFFVDGDVVFTATLAGTIYFSDQVCIGNNFYETGGSSTELVAGSYSDYVDDLYISESCKWSAAFDPSTITY